MATHKNVVGWIPETTQGTTNGFTGFDLPRYTALARQTQGTDEGDVAGCLRELLDDSALAAARGSANRLVLGESDG